MTFRALGRNTPAIIHYLEKREMVTNVYCPSYEPVVLTSDDPDSPTHAKAYIFVANTTHAQYAGKLSADEIVRLVNQGHAKTGPYFEYLQTTLDHLKELGIEDPSLAWIVTKTLSTES